MARNKTEVNYNFGWIELLGVVLVLAKILGLHQLPHGLGGSYCYHSISGLLFYWHSLLLARYQSVVRLVLHICSIGGKIGSAKSNVLLLLKA
jgi:hypothetical protein